MNVYWVWLSTLPYVGPVLQKRFIKKFKTPQAVYEADVEEVMSVQSVGSRVCDSLFENRSLKKAEEILAAAERRSMKLLSIDSPLYPAHAKSCPQSPVLLYYKGCLRAFEDAVAVVGARRCTDYGKKIAAEIGTEAATCGVTVISGLAKGIDSYAHTSCLKENGYTIAMLGSGVDFCYPKEHLSLYEHIIEKGAVVSAYPPGTKPNPKQFLERNALISAWSRQVVVVEAGEKSGSLTTADFAVKHGRTLLAVPNQIHLQEGKGTNRLIEKGARPYLGKSSLNFQRSSIVKKSGRKAEIINGENKMEQIVLELLGQEAYPISKLSHKLGVDERVIMELLFSMELEGKLTMRGEWVKKGV
jgi:DNA processing protein